MYWIAVSFVTAEFGGYILGSLAVLLLVGFLSFFYAIPFLLIKFFNKNLKHLYSAIIAIFFLALFDWVKGNILWGFPWLPLSAIWASNKFFISPFATFGVWGYSLLTFFLIVGLSNLKRDNRLVILLCMPFIITILTIFYRQSLKQV